MGKTALNAYLMFKGDCREAMNFYQSIFGGNVHLMTYGETDGSCPDAMKNAIMHGQLMGGEAELMGADDPQNGDLAMGRIQLALSGTDEAKLTNTFNSLSEGGKVSVPLAKQMWGDLFGMFTDKYGIGWMVNIGSEQK